MAQQRSLRPRPQVATVEEVRVPEQDLGTAWAAESDEHCLSIGEMVERTGVSERLLRYYEDKGLLHPERTSRGHRMYAPTDIPRANLIRFLIRGGFQTTQIRFLFDCIAHHIDVRPLCGELLVDLQSEVDRINEELQDLTRTRDYIASLLRGPDSRES
ncbi:MerR family transcriptional regulator [Microbacterium foliorum]|uniref:MerR family transcriptional regulator n=1 Tax=Microbacterium foliorum TaxID=104336 RepID=UPI0009E648C9|nr:MerR family transcriptional regulator [Microbacterium foliorum]AXL12574.1 MerR family transcriptional regulator [Microbacterium foliorum]